MFIYTYIYVYTHTYLHTLFLDPSIMYLLYGTVVRTNFVFNPAHSCCKLSTEFVFIYLVYTWKGTTCLFDIYST